MDNINQSLEKFIEALRADEPVALNVKGEWKMLGFFQNLLTSEDRRLENLTENFSRALDDLEKIPVHFDTLQPIDFKQYLAAADLILSSLKHKTNLSKAKHNLERRVIGLKFRLEGQNGGLDAKAAEQNILSRLIQMAREWKANEVTFTDNELTREEVQKMELAARHHEFADLLIEDPATRHQFFVWAMRDRNEVLPFIQFPAAQQKIVKANLHGRIGRMGGKQLKISLQNKAGHSIKILSLPFEGKDASILDDQAKVTFRGHYTLTIAEIFKIFEDKNIRVGNLELLKDGIVNWNVHQLGWWDADRQVYETIDIAQPGWWKQLPFQEILTQKQAKDRYGVSVELHHWIAAASATRGSVTLDFDQTHAFLEIAIPMNNGRFAVYDFGKFATRFPSSFMEAMSMFCQTVPATVAFPDENIYYTHRQHALHAYALTPEQGMRLMESIRCDVIKARAGNLVYQIESENCAKWLHEKLEGVLGQMPNLFKMHLLDTEPVGFVSVIFSLIRKLPRSFQIPVLTALHLPLGAQQEIWILENGQFISRSLSTHEFWLTGVVYLPAFLHKQLENGALEIQGEVQPEIEVLSFGHPIAERLSESSAFKAGSLPVNPILQGLLSPLKNASSQMRAYASARAQPSAGLASNLALA